MSLDIERYRGELAQFNLTKEQEDALITDLWKIMETLVEQIQNPTFYPLYSAITKEAIDSLEDAIRVESKYLKKLDETSFREESDLTRKTDKNKEVL